MDVNKPAIQADEDTGGSIHMMKPSGMTEEQIREIIEEYRENWLEQDEDRIK